MNTGMILCVVFITAQGVKTNARPESEMKQLLGEWSKVSGTADGRPWPEDQIMREKMTILKDKIVFTTKGADDIDINVNAQYLIDSKATPKTIDITHTDAEKTVWTMKGIYKLDGDTLTLCYGDEKRPAQFESKPESRQLLVVYKRKKAAK
jgi:uncharacterized protein (TIGR03067 family)